MHVQNREKAIIDAHKKALDKKYHERFNDMDFGDQTRMAHQYTTLLAMELQRKLYN